MNVKSAKKLPPVTDILAANSSGIESQQGHVTIAGDSTFTAELKFVNASECKCLANQDALLLYFQCTIPGLNVKSIKKGYKKPFFIDEIHTVIN